MGRRSFTLPISITLAIASSASAQGTLTVNAGRGPVTVSLPSGYDPAVPAPLLVMLHGLGVTGPAQELYFQFQPLQDQYGFLYCTPNAIGSGVGIPFWNATDACCDFQNSGVDDSGYLRALIEEIELAANVDPRRIHMIGHSNGAFMVHRMACDHADKLASVASLAGATYFNPGDCGASEPVHVLQIHGTNDNLVAYNGGLFPLSGVPFPGAVATVAQWAARHGCDTNPLVIPQALDLDRDLPGNETTITRYASGCSAGGSAELWTIVGGEHRPALTDSFRHTVLQHLFARSKPDVAAAVYCSPAAPNSTGSPARITADGSDVLVDNQLTLNATGLPVDGFGIFLTSRTQGLSQPAGSQGTLCLGGSIGRFSASVLSSGALGSFSLTPDLGALPGNPSGPAVAGETWNFQAWYRDRNPMPTSNLTDAVSVLLR